MADTERTNRLGVNLTERRAIEAGLIFREQTTSDYGIDAQLELKDGSNPTGRLIAVQIKAGPSQFANETTTGFWHYISDRHKNLWVNHSLPVVIVLCDIETDVCYYEVATNETCLPAGQKWKILIPKDKVFGTSSLPDLISIASPVAAASDFTIVSEQDMSYAGAKRIRLDIVLHAGVRNPNRPLLGAIVRQALKIGRESQYSRDEIAAKALAGRAVDVVWGFVYLREIDRESASWVCHFQWVSDDLPEASRPSEISGEEDGSGLVIDWKANTDLPKLMDERRATKADYLNGVDRLLEQLPAIENELTKIVRSAKKRPNTADFEVMAAEFEEMWESQFAAPLECQRLNRAIQELLATVGNAGLICGEWDSRGERPTRSLIRGYHDQLARLNSDISFLRRDVR